MTTTYDDKERTPAALDSSGLRPGMRIVVMVWATRHGPCHDCGLPAAFKETGLDHRLCAVCAANTAADGVGIVRLNPDA